MCTTISGGGSSSLQGLLAQKSQLERELREIEAEIMDLEGSYLEDTSTTGNILKGWDGYFQSGPQARGSARAVKIKNADRAFSDSSRTAPLKPEEDEPAGPSAGAGNNNRKDTQKSRRDKRDPGGRAKLGRKKRNDDDFDEDEEDL